MNISFDREKLKRLIWGKGLNCGTLSKLSREKRPYLSASSLRTSIRNGTMSDRSLYKLSTLLRYTEADLRRLIAAKTD